jgi:hypothetical protein
VAQLQRRANIRQKKHPRDIVTVRSYFMPIWEPNLKTSFVTTVWQAAPHRRCSHLYEDLPPWLMSVSEPTVPDHVSIRICRPCLCLYQNMPSLFMSLKEPTIFVHISILICRPCSCLLRHHLCSYLYPHLPSLFMSLKKPTIFVHISIRICRASSCL